MMKAGHYSGYKYPKGGHWTSILKSLIPKNEKITWKNAIEKYWKPYKKQNPNKTKLYVHTKIEIEPKPKQKPEQKPEPKPEPKPKEDILLWRNEKKKPKTETINGNIWAIYGKFGYNKTFFETLKRVYSYGRSSSNAFKIDAELRKELIAQQIGHDFFPTPESAVDKIMNYIKKNKNLFGIGYNDSKIHLLEPSAGTGAIIKGYIDNFAFDTEKITANEYESDLLLKKNLLGVDVKKGDFLKLKEDNYDLIIMNPPFNSPGQKDKIYYDHIFHAMSLLGRFGHIIVICPDLEVDEQNTELFEKTLGPAKKEKLHKLVPSIMKKEGKNYYIDRYYDVTEIGTSKGEFIKFSGGKPTNMNLTTKIYDIEVI